MILIWFVRLLTRAAPLSKPYRAATRGSGLCGHRTSLPDSGSGGRYTIVAYEIGAVWEMAAGGSGAGERFGAIVGPRGRGGAPHHDPHAGRGAALCLPVHAAGAGTLAGALRAALRRPPGSGFAQELRPAGGPGLC